MYNYIVVWSLIGFSLLSGLTANFGGDNTLFSVFFRALAAGIAITLFMNRFNVKKRLILWLFLTFWSVYFVRLYVSLHLLAEPVSRSPETYWIWSVGACFLPSMAILVSHDTASLERLRQPPIILSILAGICLLAAGSTNMTGMSGEIYDINRLNIKSLNPISMGHAGVTVLLLSVGTITICKRDPSKIFVGLVGIMLGATLVLLANSRGPIVSLVITLGIFLLARLRHRSTYLLGGLIFAVASYVVIQFPALLFGDSGTFSRFTTISSNGDLAAISRFISYRGALDQFVGSPLLGDGIEERITQQYPHNVILEAFMATGVLGGGPFLLIFVTAIRSAWGLIQLNSQLAWVGLVALQQLIGVQFSGSLWATNTMWVMMILVIVCWQFERESQR